MRLTPFAKFFIFIVIVGVVGYVAWKRYGAQRAAEGPRPESSTAAPAAEGDRGIFGKLAQPLDTGQDTSAVAATSAGSGKLNRPLVVAINTWAGHAPGLVANGGLEQAAASIYAKKGVPVSFKLIEDPSAKLTALISGQVDVMWDTVDSWAREAGVLQEKGIAARAVIQEDWSRGGDGIVSLKSIESVEDLKGRKIATTQFTPSHWLLLYLLAQSGLSREDKQALEKNLVFTAEAPLAAAAFKSGNVDAAVTWEPDLTLAVNARPNDAHILISTAAATHIIADVLVARQQAIDGAPETLAAFVAGWFEAIDEMQKNRAATTAVVAKALKLTADDVDGMLSGLKLTGWPDNAWFFGLTSPQGTASHYQNLFDAASTIWRSHGAITKVADARDRLEPKFVGALAGKYKGQTVSEVFPGTARPGEHKAPASKGVINKILMIHFAQNSDRLLPGSEYVLDSLGETLTSFGNTTLQVEGHTDAVGSARSNLSLSERRAAAVRDYLVSHFQVKPERFKTYGFGAARPIASNETLEGQAANRRTEIRVLLNQ
ncbi:MAG TPA: phosphate ABC transporter substrate-binding/OmpA family protein [Myxococcales bacterium]|nr:phosphate ABC transporter substrate-binding/OmpA family protein [Myxococcales bacterium]